MKMMNRQGIAVLVSLGAAFINSIAFGSAWAQSSVSTEAPQQKSKMSVHAAPKPKAVHAKKPDAKTPDLSELDKTPPSRTIPMDFSGMAKRPVDLPSEYDKSPKSGDKNETFKPGMNSNSNGGFSPGMNLNF